MAKYQGAGEVFAADYHAVKFVGKTKSGKALTIEMPKAVNLGNIEWAFAEKGDTVATVAFSGAYSNTDAMVTTRTEPWTIEIDGTQTSGAAEIITGAGLVYIDNQPVALTRGGSTFAVNRTFREINADGDYVYTGGKWNGMVFHPYTADAARELVPNGTICTITDDSGALTIELHMLADHR